MILYPGGTLNDLLFNSKPTAKHPRLLFRQLRERYLVFLCQWSFQKTQCRYSHLSALSFQPVHIWDRSIAHLAEHTFDWVHIHRAAQSDNNCPPLAHHLQENKC